MYEGLVAPYYDTDLLVESWIRGSAEGAYCKPKYKYKVIDVEVMQVHTDTGDNITWTEGQDHLKSGRSHLIRTWRAWQTSTE